MSGGIGPFEGMQDEKTGEMTVFCDAASHELWQQVFSRRGDAPWMPDPFESIGDHHVRTPRRGAGIEFIDAASRVVQVWDTGRGVTDPRSAEGLTAELKRSRAAAGVGPNDYLPLGRRYQLRCPLCGDTVRRSERSLSKQFNQLWGQGITRISLNGLRVVDELM